MEQYADILAFDKDGELALMAEIKNKWGTSDDWAAKMRRNMFAHRLMPSSPFFLLALPDVFYLWHDIDSTLEPIPPTLKVDPRSFLQPYFETSGNSLHNLTGRSFELVVTSWLNQVLSTNSPQNLSGEDQKWLISSGLFNRLAGGHLTLQTAA